MGGAVSTGRDNDDLIDNLLEANYIKTAMVERVFRAVDRGEYFLHPLRGGAYKDLAWKSGNLHISAPCIYSKVMEGLELRPGLSFLNLGSGTGYLSTMVGLVLGSNGLNHGIELQPDVVAYANRKLADFKRLSGGMDEYDFCEPQFVQGNCLCLMNNGHRLYDRVYCGAACPSEYAEFVKGLLKVGGILVMPLNDKLLQIRRVSHNGWEQDSLLPVTFATLVLPSPDHPPSLLEIFEVNPQSLQCMCRTLIRGMLRKNVEAENWPLRRQTTAGGGANNHSNNDGGGGNNKAPKKKRALKKIVVPLFDSDTSDDEARGERGRRDRSRGRAAAAAMNSAESETLMNFVLGTLHGTRREFLRTHRRPQHAARQPPANNNNDNDDAGRGRMEVDGRGDGDQPMDTGERAEGKLRGRNGRRAVGEVKRSVKADNGWDKMDEDEFVNARSDMLEDSDEEAGGTSKNTADSNRSNDKSNNNKNDYSRADNLEDPQSPGRGDDSFFSFIHMPRSLVIDGVVITNIQTLNPMDESVNESDQNDSESKRDSTASDNGRVNDAGGEKSRAKTDPRPTTSKSHKITTTADINVTENRSCKSLAARSSGRSSLEPSDVEIACENCDSKPSGEGGSSSGKKPPPKPRNGNRNKSDSGLGDEIIKSDLLNSSSEEECDHEFKFVRNSSSSDTEDCDDDDDGDRKAAVEEQEEEEEDAIVSQRVPKRRVRPSLRWSTRIELDRRDSSSSSSSSGELVCRYREEDVCPEITHRMYHSPYTRHMTEKIQQLPLPIMLKNFINYNRNF